MSKYYIHALQHRVHVIGFATLQHVQRGGMARPEKLIQEGEHNSTEDAKATMEPHTHAHYFLFYHRVWIPVVNNGYYSVQSSAKNEFLLIACNHKR